MLALKEGDDDGIGGEPMAFGDAAAHVGCFLDHSGVKLSAQVAAQTFGVCGAARERGVFCKGDSPVGAEARHQVFLAEFGVGECFGREPAVAAQICLGVRKVGSAQTFAVVAVCARAESEVWC